MSRYYFLLVIVVFLVLPLSASARKVRVYCKPEGVYLLDIGSGGDGVVGLVDGETFVLDSSEVPDYDYPEQLRCKDGELVVDRSYIPPYVKREQKIKELEAQLDDELGKADPDVVTVLRLQRQIEKLKRGEDIVE